MADGAKKADFNQIPLKYKDVEAFKKAAEITFNKGRMTLKSKKDLQEGERIILLVKFKTTDRTIQIISEIIQRKSAQEEGKPNTYGIRWLNFTEKKLKKFLEETGVQTGETEVKKSTPPPPPEQPAQKAEPPPPPEPPSKTPEEHAGEPSRESEAAPSPGGAKETVKKSGPATDQPPEEKPLQDAEPAPEAEQEHPPPEHGPDFEKLQEAVPQAEPSLQEQSPEEPEFAENREEAAEEGTVPWTDEGEEPAPSSEGTREMETETPSYYQQEQEEETGPAAEPASQPEPSEEPIPLGGEEAVPSPEETTPGQESRETEETQGEAPEEKNAPLPADQPAPSFEETFSSDGDEELDLLSALDESSGKGISQRKEAPARQESVPEPESEADADTSNEVQPVTGQEQETAGEESEMGEEIAETAEPETGEEPTATEQAEPGEAPPSDHEPASQVLADLEAGAGEDDFNLSGVLEEEPSNTGTETEQATPPDEEGSAEEPASYDEQFDESSSEPAEEEIETGSEPSREEVEQEQASFIEAGDESSEFESKATEPEDEAAEPEAESSQPEVSTPPQRVPQRLAGVELSALSSFLVKFSRAVLDPSNCRAEGNEAALESLYEEFKYVMNERNEIIVHVRSRGPTREFMVGGDVAEPVNLKNILSAEDFEKISLSLVDFFDAKGFTGLQLRRYLSSDAFVSLVRTLASYYPESQTPEDLGAALISEGVFHATPVHESERVVSDPSLDFRVDMTLSRLRGEINRLKYLAEAMEEDPDAVWTLRVEDALKALPEGSLLAEILLRAEDVVSGQEEIDSGLLSQEMLLATPVENLAEAGRHLCLLYEDLYLRAGKTDENKEYLDKIQKTLRQVSARLVVEDPDSAAQIMGDLYRRGVFTLDELPSELRERMMVEQFVDSFLEDPDKRLEDFEGIKKVRDYRAAARRYVLMIAELLRKKRVDEAERIFRTLLEHWKTPAQDFPERADMAAEALKLLARPDCIKVLVNSLTDPGKARREKVASILYAAGPEAAPALIDQLAATEDRNTRRLICEILTRLGPDVAEQIKARALESHVPWYLLRNLIMVLGDMKSDVLAEDLERFLSHEHERVREEVLVYTAKALGTESEPYLVKALSDSNPLVQRRAVRLLSRFPQLSDEAIQALSELLVRRPETDPPPEAEQAVELAATVLSRLGNVSLTGQKSLEDLIIEALEADASRGLFGKLTGSRSKRTPKMRLALVEALSEVGTKKSRKLLGSLAKDKDQAIKETARKALEKIGG